MEAGRAVGGKGWQNKGYIFPDGFRSRTVFRSSIDPEQVCSQLLCRAMIGALSVRNATYDTSTRESGALHAVSSSASPPVSYVCAGMRP